MSKLTEAVLQNTASLEAAVNTAAQLGGVERQHCVKNPLKGQSNEILASSFFNLVIPTKEGGPTTLLILMGLLVELQSAFRLAFCSRGKTVTHSQQELFPVVVKGVSLS